MTVRVLVTRPRDQAERTAARLRALGHEALVAPVLDIRPTGVTPPPGPFAAAILTSANAVPALAGHVLQGLAPARIFVIGERTALAAQKAGLSGVQGAAESGGNGAALARKIIAAVAPGAALLIVAGRERKPEPEASLRAADFCVAVWEAYAACPVAEMPAGLRVALSSGGLDAALHYSRRSTETALELAATAGLLAPFLGLAHHALSQDVADPLLAACAGTVVIAGRADEASLLAGLPASHSRPARTRC